MATYSMFNMISKYGKFIINFYPVRHKQYTDIYYITV